MQILDNSKVIQQKLNDVYSTTVNHQTLFVFTLLNFHEIQKPMIKISAASFTDLTKKSLAYKKKQL